MNKLNNDKSKKYFLDKTLLILSAIILLLCLLFILFYLKKFKIKKEWIDFISMSFFYIVIFIHGINKTLGLKKRITNLVSLLSLIFFTIFPIFIGYILLYYKILPFPKRAFFTYFLVLIIVLSISALCFFRSLKFLERRKRSKAGN